MGTPLFAGHVFQRARFCNGSGSGSGSGGGSSGTGSGSSGSGSGSQYFPYQAVTDKIYHLKPHFLPPATT